MSVTGSSDLIGRAPGGRKLIAVVYADMVGYGRLIGLDDIGTFERLRTLRSTLIDPAINEHGGKLIQTGGDSLLIAFDSIDGAVRSAVKMQQRVPNYNGDQPPDRAILFRIGINIGDVIADGTDLHGDGVNVAARLQAECPPGGICVSRAVRDHVHGRLDLVFDELGALSLKNIARPVEALYCGLSQRPPRRDCFRQARFQARASERQSRPDFLSWRQRCGIWVFPKSMNISLKVFPRTSLLICHSIWDPSWLSLTPCAATAIPPVRETSPGNPAGAMRYRAVSGGLSTG
jgi:class 3 adenylate cyclase